MYLPMYMSMYRLPVGLGLGGNPIPYGVGGGLKT